MSHALHRRKHGTVAEGAHVVLEKEVVKQSLPRRRRVDEASRRVHEQKIHTSQHWQSKLRRWSLVTSVFAKTA
jgi:hypothetical protein